MFDLNASILRIVDILLIFHTTTRRLHTPSRYKWGRPKFTPYLAIAILPSNVCTIHRCCCFGCFTVVRDQNSVPSRVLLFWIGTEFVLWAVWGLTWVDLIFSPLSRSLSDKLLTFSVDRYKETSWWVSLVLLWDGGVCYWPFSCWLWWIRAKLYGRMQVCGGLHRCVHFMAFEKERERKDICGTHVWDVVRVSGGRGMRECFLYIDGLCTWLIMDRWVC